MMWLINFILILLMLNPAWGTEITCRYFKVVSRKEAEKILCSASCAAITSPNETATLKKVEYDKNKIRMLRFFQNTIHYMPNGIDKIFPRLLELSIVTSRLKEITQNDLKPFPELRVLELYENDLEYLESDLLKFNPNLRFIHLDGNKLKMIGENLLDPLINLEHAYFSNSGCLNVVGDYPGIKNELMKAIKENCQDTEILKKFMKGSDEMKRKIQKFEITCSYDDNAYYDHGINGVECTASCTTITSRDGTATLKNVEYDKNEIKLLRFHFKTIHYMPKGIKNIFPRLLGLVIYDSGLKEITHKDLKGFPELRYLGLPGNRLEYLENDLLKFNPDLRYIEFNGNTLRMIGENLLVPLTNLEYVHFFKAGCVDVSGDYPEIKDELMKAIKEDCQDTEKMKKITKGSNEMKRQTQKFEITCSYDDDAEWVSGINGVECDASCTTITSRNETAILKNVEYDKNEIKLLSFYFKTIHYMPKGIENIFPRLLGLYIYVSGLKEITQKDLKGFPELRVLGLSGNRLEYLESDLFKFNPDLRAFEFNVNTLKMIGENLLVPLTNLEYVYFNKAGCLSVYGNYPEIKDQLIKSIKKNCQDTEILEKFKTGKFI